VGNQCPKGASKDLKPVIANNFGYLGFQAFDLLAANLSCSDARSRQLHDQVALARFSVRKFNHAELAQPLG
jgi:hypothetical protein